MVSRSRKLVELTTRVENNENASKTLSEDKDNDTIRPRSDSRSSSSSLSTSSSSCSSSSSSSGPSKYQDNDDSVKDPDYETTTKQNVFDYSSDFDVEPGDTTNCNNISVDLDLIAPNGFVTRKQS
ncbi:hypothetical protein evm_014478 [Chilo suppressalis]|nr:hypothetical protein evm_014478 [Chilo suppressalis]